MTSDRIQTAMLIIGAFFLIVGIVVRLGLWKDWYWKGLRTVHGYLPMGILFILLYFNPQISQIIQSKFLNYYLPIIVLLGMSAWFSARTPEYIKPTWITWIENYPPRVVDEMKKDVKAGVDWVDKVKDKSSVDAWARQLKYKMPKKK